MKNARTKGTHPCVRLAGRFAAWIIGFIALGAGLAFAQLSAGTISGNVQDSSGAALPGATITVTSRETGRVRTTVTSANGQYALPALPSGTYDVRAEAPSFRPEIRQELDLAVGQEAVLNFSLSVGAVQETVTVMAETPLVETTSGSLGGLVDDDRVADLPLNGRNFTDLVLLQTGINVHRPVSTTSSSARGLAYSSNGAPIYSNYVVMDGANLTAARGRNGPSMSGAMLGVEGIREFRVLTNAFPAQYGVTMGSQVTVVSKSGTNAFHGSAFEFLRNDKLDARDFFAGEKPPLRRNNFGGAFGGPIIQDKTFFFLTYEGLRERLGLNRNLTTVTAAARQDGVIVPTVDPDVKPFLALYPLPTGPLPNDPDFSSGLGRFNFGFSQPTKEDFGQARVDHNFSETDNVFFRWTVIDSAQIKKPTFPEFDDDGKSRGQYLTLGWNHTLSPTLLNVFGLSYSRNLELATSASDPNLPFIPGIPMGIITNQGGISTLGPRNTAPLDFRFHDIAFTNDIFWTRGSHSVKFGLLVKWENMYAQASTRRRGEYRFGSLEDFLEGTPNRFRGLTPGAIVDRTYRWNIFGFYVQDDWRIASNFTLNLGLRYEPHSTVNETKGRGLTLRDQINDGAFTPGEPLFDNDSNKNFGPRFGFAWDVFGDASTAVRGGFGLLYDLTSNIGNTAVHGLGNPPLSGSSTITSRTANTTLDFPFTVVPPNAQGKSIRTFDFNLQQPHMLHWNLTVERQLPASMMVSLAYAASRGINLLQSKEGNPVFPSDIINGRVFWTGDESRVNPVRPVEPGSDVLIGFDDMELKTAAGDSWYNALQFSLRKRYSHGLQFQSSYTWSKVLDTTQGQFGGESGGSPNFGVDPLNNNTDKGPADFDNRHAWTFNTLYELPNPDMEGIAGTFLSGWRLGTILTLRSGTPFSVRLGRNRSRSQNGGSDADRPDLISGRNPDNIILGGPDRYFDPSAFVLQPAGFLGTASRNFLQGPGLVNWDFSIRKDTSLAFLGESGRLEFRTEFFNLLNRANFRVPINGRTVINGRRDTDPVLPTAGQIDNTIKGIGRNIQFALKVVF